MSLFFGYTSFVRGECAAATYIHYQQHLEPLMVEGMYQQLPFRQFVKYGLNRFYTAMEPYYTPAKIHYPELTREDFYSCLIYFYNRQLIVQMFMIPKPYFQSLTRAQLAKPIYVPIFRDVGFELQADIMVLTPTQQEFNYERKYLLVIIDPLTRFCWAMPVQTLTSDRVLKALAAALSRPGISQTFYEKIFQPLCKMFTVDGGSEFKDLFQEHYKLLFPHAQLRNSEAKWRTGGRPTLTGPIEACIRTLRKTIRDYEIAYEKTFLAPDEDGKSNQAGLDQILKTYNQQPQTTTLHSFSPEQMARSILVRQTHRLEHDIEAWEVLGNEEELQRLHVLDHVHFIDSFLHQTESKRQQKIQEQKQQKQHIFEDILSPNLEEYGLRKKLKDEAPGFRKEIHYRVSLSLYSFVRFDPQYPNFCYVREQPFENEEAPPGPEERVLLRELVVVKTPLQLGPPPIRENLLREFHHTQQRPRRAMVHEPFPISNVIQQQVDQQPNAAVRRLFQRPNYERPRMNPPRARRGEVPVGEAAPGGRAAPVGAPPRPRDIYAREYHPFPFLRVRGLERLRRGGLEPEPEQDA